MQKAELICLVRGAQRGDAQAFDALVRRFQNPAVLYARSLLRFERGDAEDAAQEAFVQAWRDLPMLQTPEAFPAWLRRIVFKHCDRVRRRPHCFLVPLADAATLAGGPEPFGAASASEDRARLRDALETLPGREREAALLYYWNDHSLAEIAAFLGVPQTTVKNRLHAARKRLRKELWEMAEAILEREQPSRDDAFAGAILARVLGEFRRQMKADPHTANRGLLAEGRAALEAAIVAPGPLAWKTVRDGFSLLLDQSDLASVPTLMRRYLAQPLDGSHQFWAYYHLGNDLACSGDAAGAVLAHETLERLLPQMSAHVSPDWPFDPMPADAPDDVVLTSEAALRLVAIARSGEFADAWFAVGRGDEYLRKIDDALQALSPSDQNRPWRFTALRMAVSRSQMHQNIERARGYVAQLYALADEPESPAERAHWRLKAIVHEISVLRVTEEKGTALERCREASALLAQFPNEHWSAGERHNLAHTLMFLGHPALALPLFEQNAAAGGQANGWGYLMYAAAVYSITGDRARALQLVRAGAVRERADMTENFQKLSEFADVKDDPEFLAALRRQGF